MIDKDKRRHYRASVHFSQETMRQANELEQMFNESRSRVVSRAVEYLYNARINEKKESKG